MNNQNIIEKSNQIYDDAFSKYGNDVRSTMCANPIRQYFRFNDLTTHIDLNDSTKTILEVGCGSGEMYKYLKMKGYRGKYVGYDINQNLLNLAKQRFTDIDVQLVDILTDKIDNQFDYVLMSGVFNINFGQEMDWIQAFVKKMFELCKNHIAFNALSTYVNFKEEGMFYIEPAEMLKFCIENLSKRVNLSHHNLPYNYTIIVFKEEDINTSVEIL